MHTSIGSNQAPDWALLPRAIVISILEILVSEVSEYIHAATVCRNWLSAAHDHLSLAHRSPFFPQLLLPTEDKSETHRAFYNAIENRIVDTRLRVPYNKRCCGSSHGWLIFCEETALVLFNPFAGVTFHLPPVISSSSDDEIDGGESSYDTQYEIQKVVLSADPSSAPDNYDALAIFAHNNLAFFRCGCVSWIYVIPDAGSPTYEEITYFDGNFYAANLKSLVRLDVVCESELEGNFVSVSLKKLASRKVDRWVHKTYLVGTPYGHLLWVDRYYTFKSIGIVRDDGGRIMEYFEIDNDDDQSDDSDDTDSQIHHFTSGFKVYEVKEEVDGKTQLTELKTLDDDVLFLGHNDSELTSTRNFPGYRGNCIYYMDDCVHLIMDGTPYPFGAVDMGVFDLEDQCCKPLETVGGGGKGHMPPPIWIVPKAKLPSETTSF